MKKLMVALVAVVLLLSMLISSPVSAQAPILLNAMLQSDGSIIATGDNFVVAYCTVTADAGAPYAIYNNGYSGSIHHNTVEGGYHGILVDSGSTTPNPAVYVKIAYNTVNGFTKTGILNGRYPPSNAGITANIMNNTVMSEPSATVAGNGIAIECGGVGMVMGNTVGNVEYTGEDWTACGILLFEVQGVTVRGNTVTSCQTGIGVASFDWTGPANNNNVVGNTVLDADWGISLQAVVLNNGYASQTNNNKVVNNNVSHPGEGNGLTGIEVWPYVWPGLTGNPVLENNKIIANSISGYDISIDDGGTETKVHANMTP